MEISNRTMTLASDDDDLGAARGVIVGVLIAIPLWILIGVALVAVLPAGSAGETMGFGWTFEKICSAFLMSCAA